MKLRLQSNSVRLRLKRAEVARLAEIGTVEEILYFGDGADEMFRYTLETSSTIPEIRADLSKREILIQVPARLVSHWARSDDVGMENNFTVGNGRQLQVLIEKDFACVDGNAEQNYDTFPNPLAETKCKA